MLSASCGGSSRSLSRPVPGEHYVSPMELDALLAPAHLYSRAEVMTRPSPVPRLAGIYGWYFDMPPGDVPAAASHEWQGHRLLYVGIAPKKPAVLAVRASRRTLAKRIREHYNLNAAGSTLRLTLGCLLGLELRLIASRKYPGTATRMTFGLEGEQRLSAWMAKHARVVWLPCEQAWTVEDRLLEQLALPLNLDGHRHGAFHAQLSSIRVAAKSRARSLPPLDR